MAAAQRACVIHRDIKPANLFLIPEGESHQVKILGFGLGQPMASAAGVTQTGMVVGMTQSMAPEQIGGYTLYA